MSKDYTTDHLDDARCSICDKARVVGQCASHVVIDDGFVSPFVQSPVDGDCIILDARRRVVSADVVIAALDARARALEEGRERGRVAATLTARHFDLALPAPPQQTEVERRAVAVFGEQARWVVGTTTQQTRAMLSHALGLAEAAKADTATRAALSSEVETLRRVAADAERTVDLLRARLARAEQERDEARATAAAVVAKVRAVVEVLG